MCPNEGFPSVTQHRGCIADEEPIRLIVGGPPIPAVDGRGAQERLFERRVERRLDRVIGDLRERIARDDHRPGEGHVAVASCGAIGPEGLVPGRKFFW